MRYLYGGRLWLISRYYAINADTDMYGDGEQSHLRLYPVQYWILEYLVNQVSSVLGSLTHSILSLH